MTTSVSRVYSTLLLPIVVATLVAGWPTVACSQSYSFGNVALGPGGFVDGIVLGTGGAEYIRTDVAGVFKWTGNTSGWANLCQFITPDIASGLGADGIAVDPTNDAVLFAAIGNSQSAQSGVWKSTDSGNTWSLVFSHDVEPNYDNRQDGECLLVDPNSSGHVIYFGSRDGLLFSSSTGGVIGSWVQCSTNLATSVLSTPNNEPVGIRSIAIDKNGGATNGRSSKVFVSVWGRGVFASTDGGNSFSLLNGSPVFPHRIAVTSSGDLIVSNTMGIAKYDGGKWYDITPSGYDQTDFIALAVDPNNAGNVVVARNSSPSTIFTSYNGGWNWSAPFSASHNNITATDNVPWYSYPFAAAPDALAFGTTQEGTVLLGDAYTCWNTGNIFAANQAWSMLSLGLENQATIALLSPSAGAPLISGVQDNTGFINTSIKQYPASRISLPDGWVPVITGLDFCESSPNFLAITGNNYNYDCQIAVSANGGESWTGVPIPAAITKGDGLVGCAKICVSATSTSHLVFFPSGGKGVWYTTSGGATWAQGSLPNGVDLNRSNLYYSSNLDVCSDRSNGNYFYAYDQNANGNNKPAVIVSSDGGATWRTSSASLPGLNGEYSTIAAAPGHAGVVALTQGGNNNGLWLSRNFGQSFTQVGSFINARLIAWGTASSNGNPTAYCYGKRTGDVWGIYRSNDLCQTWTRITTTSDPGSNGNALVGDRQTLGNVYLANANSGIMYGTDGGH